MKLSDMPWRDYYALEIIKGIVARREARSEIQVRQAYDVADALLKFQDSEHRLRDREMEALKKRAEIAENTLEVLRPVWAQGWTTDSVAAQRSAAALAQIWERLGVDNQTAAMQEISSLYVDRETVARS